MLADEWGILASINILVVELAGYILVFVRYTELML